MNDTYEDIIYREAAGIATLTINRPDVLNAMRLITIAELTDAFRQADTNRYIGVIVLRRTAPELPRGFRVPLFPLTPILSIAGCFWIIKDLRAVTIYVFVIWASVAIAWYFFYGIRNSRLGKPS